jgi:hypothetical protein
MPATDHLGTADPFQAAHWSCPCLQPAMIDLITADSGATYGGGVQGFFVPGSAAA